MAKEKGSGRGLDAIFIDNYDIEETAGREKTTVRISEIEPESTQPRTIFEREALEELATSIATHGLIQPIVVREGSNGLYRIIAGERRWRASKMAGLSEVPVIIIDADDRKAAELSLIENLQRENLNPIEEAAAFKALIDEYGLTHDEVSSRIGKSRSAVTNTMRLLNLPEEVVELVKNNQLSAGHARALLGLSDTELICKLAKDAVSKELSVRQLEALINRLKNAPKTEEPAAIATVQVDYVADLEKRVSSQMGRLFKIHTKGKRKKIELEYSDERDLENIIRKLCGDSVFDD